MPIYPPAPWRLYGWAVQTLHAIPIDVARRFVPPKLAIVPVWPGYTLATVIFASYESGSLAYQELLAGIGLVWLRGPRFCIPRLWVDNEASLAGGREIWKLPKELASFNVQHTNDAIRIDAAGICRIEARTNRYNMPLWLPVFAFGQRGDAFYPFTASLRAAASLAHAHITSLNAELSSLELGRPLLSIHYNRLDVVVQDPGAGAAPLS